MDAVVLPELVDTKANGELPTEDNGHQTTDASEPDSTRPASTCGSQGQPAPSTAPSLSSLSLEERLRRMRAAEEIRQKQRYAAYLESQKQAEQARIKAQEERRLKLEEMHQRAEARRLSVLQRRQEIELSNKARLELIRERSRTRFTDQSACRRRCTESSTGAARTASASPSIGSARNPNNLMTTSCVVAFGSSAPRSICTQPSPAALRRQQAFEARLASYLTGRHSGCFLTSTAAPHYMHLVDKQTVNPSTAAFLASSKRRRRATSAHASFSRHTKASMARATVAPALTVDGSSCDPHHTVPTKETNSETGSHCYLGSGDEGLSPVVVLASRTVLSDILGGVVPLVHAPSPHGSHCMVPFVSVMRLHLHVY